MFKKPKPFELNGLAELVRENEDSKSRRGRTVRSLMMEVEERKRREREHEIESWIRRAQRSGAM